MFELFPPLGRIARTMGCVPARQEEGTRVLQKGGMLVVFPEGEGGSFKPSSEAYRLQPFRPGLVRLAARTRAPIVPCIITGAEETHVNLGQIKLARVLPGLKFPIPLNLLAPLPAKWRIRFLPPVRLEAIAPSDVQEDLAGETELSEAAVFQLCEALRVRHQSALDHELATRPYVFFDSASSRPKQSAEPSC
jgi:1-acyl-sn-glycerol-3-phosphate acyltransferase